MDDRGRDRQGEREGGFLFQCPEQVCRRPAVRSGLYSQPAAIDSTARQVDKKEGRQRRATTHLKWAGKTEKPEYVKVG